MIRVKAAFFSFTPTPPPDDDGSYLRWHLLDHMPEQYQLPGVQFALRYIADGDYPTGRIAATGHLVDVGNVVNYLVGDPVQQTHDDFMELGRRLAELGRFPETRPGLQLRMPALLRWYAAPHALISAEVVPFRPHRGVVVDRGGAGGRGRRDVAAVAPHRALPGRARRAGVAGAWMYGSTSTWKLHPATQGDPQYTTVIYLDDDPLGTTKAIASLVEERWQSGACGRCLLDP